MSNASDWSRWLRWERWTSNAINTDQSTTGANTTSRSCASVLYASAGSDRATKKALCGEIDDSNFTSAIHAKCHQLLRSVPPCSSRAKADDERTTPKVACRSDDSDPTKLSVSFTVARNNVQIFWQKKTTLNLGKKRREKYNKKLITVRTTSVTYERDNVEHNCRSLNRRHNLFSRKFSCNGYRTTHNKS